MKKNKVNIDPNLILTVGLIGFIYFGGRGLLKTFGVIESKEDKDEAKQIQQLQTEDYFNPNYWTKQLPAIVIKEDKTQELIEILYNSYGYFNDDEAAIYGVFETLKTKSQVSWLAYKFNERYNASLLEYLRSFLNDSELSKIAAICNKLPSYQA